MISVPEPALLPRTPRPVRFMNGSLTSSGKPCGYVGNATGVTTPISSQWPVVVSLPFERSNRRPATAGAPDCGGHPCKSATFPRPSASRLGRSSPPTARATLPNVSEPSSPYSAASGNSPAPTASSTITHARGTRLSYAACGNRPRTARPDPLHHAHPCPLGGDHVRGDQDLALAERQAADREDSLIAQSRIRLRGPATRQNP